MPYISKDNLNFKVIFQQKNGTVFIVVLLKAAKLQAVKV